MQELALLTLLAQSSKPMLANQIVEVGIRIRSRVSVGT